MLNIGITGGIGSGKSFICKVWQSLGAHIVNADDLAKNLMTSNKALKNELIEAFGEKVFQPDGVLNRTYLANQAFNNGRVEELNNMVHPVVIDEVKREIDEAEKNGYDVSVYEAALLLQNLRPHSLDCIVLVLADREKRIARVMERDGVDRKSVIDRIKRQQDFESLQSLADIVIWNNGSQNELEQKARKVYQELGQQFG